MKERERTCCFTGHRIISAQVVPQLKAELAQTVTRLIDQGVTQFVTGGALGFDTMAAVKCCVSGRRTRTSACT